MGDAAVVNCTTILDFPKERRRKINRKSMCIKQPSLKDGFAVACSQKRSAIKERSRIGKYLAYLNIPWIFTFRGRSYIRVIFFNRSTPIASFFLLKLYCQEVSILNALAPELP